MSDVPQQAEAPDLDVIISIPGRLPHGRMTWRDDIATAIAVAVEPINPERREGAVVGLQGRLSTEPEVAAFDVEVIPVPHTGMAGCGAFLLDLLVKVAWSTIHAPAARLCGPALQAQQAELVAALAGAGAYMTFEAPARFKTAFMFPSMSMPPPFIRAPAAKLRIVGPATARLAILPQHATERFSLANRASLAAWLRAKRFTVIDPDVMPFNELAATLGTAGVLLLADPRQIGLLALCQPGARVIEIAPEGWLGLIGPYLAQIFQLDWTFCRASPPSYKLLAPLPFGARVPLSYEVPIAALAKLI